MPGGLPEYKFCWHLHTMLHADFNNVFLQLTEMINKTADVTIKAVKEIGGAHGGLSL
jgi:hypothetical protein